MSKKEMIIQRHFYDLNSQY